MDIRKLAAMGLSAVLAAAVLVPAPALAVNTANAENPSDGTTPEVTGSANVTQLTLVAQDPDANLASNGGSAWVAQRAKVQVPVAINFVVTGTGDVEGPSSAGITNYSSFPVSVSNIKVTAAQGKNVAFASTAAGATAADQVYLQFQPGANATAVNLSQFTGANGAAPTSGEWNIGPGSASAGTSLALTDFSGHVGGFSSLDPLSQEAFATIAWTIKAGSAQSVALPNRLNAANSADLQAAGAAIRNGDVTAKAYYDTLVGQTTTIYYGNQFSQSATVRLVDVSTERGLTFMFTDALVSDAVIYDSNYADANWGNSRVNRYLNGGVDPELGSSPLNGGFKLDTSEQAPTYPRTITVNSLDYVDGKGHAIVATECTWWIPSWVEVFGSNAWESYATYTGDEGCVQFDYFASSPSSLNSKLWDIAPNKAWWLRSGKWVFADPNEFAQISANSNQRIWNFPSPGGRAAVVPCFCL